jgi:hypothetical protein
MVCDLITRRNAVATAAPLPMVMVEWSGLSIGAWLSLVEHLVRDQGVGGSNPLAPIWTYGNLHRRNHMPQVNRKRAATKADALAYKLSTLLPFTLDAMAHKYLASMHTSGIQAERAFRRNTHR